MKTVRLAGAVLALSASFALSAELGRFSIREPLEQDWRDEWITEDVDLQIPPAGVQVENLRVVAESGQAVPAQFYNQRQLLPESSSLARPARVGVFFKTSLAANRTANFQITDGKTMPKPVSVKVVATGGKMVIGNGVYEVEFDSREPLPINAMRCGSVKDTLGVFRWPPHLRVTNVLDRVMERGPARVIFRRDFSFADPRYYYNLRFDIRARDPWLGIQDSYNLGDGAALELDLQKLNANIVWHPCTYNARTLKVGAQEEDSTLEPERYPIATLGAAWRNSWYGGGPFAFMYNSDADHGLGIAAVQPGGWNCRSDISIESESLEIHGDREKQGRVRVRVPMDGAHRSWALIFGPPDTRRQLSLLTRSHSDVPLDRVLHKWKLDWKSTAPEFKAPAAQTYLMGHFNRPALNPDALPREVIEQLDSALKLKHVQSRDLAVLAYLFTNSDYWPDPDEAWKIGPPSFHTRMYSVPLRIGLLMPDHPDAKDWVQFGVRETYTDIMANSFPGGAWSEDDRNGFLQIVENVQLLRDYGITNGFQAWARLKEIAQFFAAMHTPGQQDDADIQTLARNYESFDSTFAAQLARFPEKWENAMDVSSREFKGFGAILRGNAYDAKHESFVKIKAGAVRYRPQSDLLSFEFWGLGAPLGVTGARDDALRAASYNRPDMDGKTPHGFAEPRAFCPSGTADVFVADEWATNVSAGSMERRVTDGPSSVDSIRTLSPGAGWKMRRYVMLVKHDRQKSKIPDYLVVRDEVISPEPVGWNLHVVAGQRSGEPPVVRFPGKSDVDLHAHFLQGGAKQVDKQEWLRVVGDSGATHWLVVLMPNRKGEMPANVERISDTSARVTLGDDSEVFHIGTDGTHQAAVERGGKTHILLPAGRVKALAKIPFQIPSVSRARRLNL